VLKFERLWVVAIAAGALLAGLPILVVERLTNTYVERNATSHLDSFAHGVLGNTEARLERASNLLVDLAKADISDCSVGSVDIMRRALYGAAPVREVVVLEDGNRVLCSSSGTIADQRVVLRETNMPGRQFALAIVSFRDQDERAMRLRLDLPGARSIAAITPVGALLNEATPANRRSSYRVRLLLDGGQLSAQQQIEAQERSFDGGQSIAVSVRSTRFPVVLIAEYSRAAMAADYDNVLLVTRLFPTVISFFLILFAWLAVRRRRTDPTSAFATALESGEIVPFFQPIVDIKTGRLRAAEVLARWRRPDGTMVMPLSFIPHAEQSGQIFEMTRMLMRRARDEVGAAYAVRPNLRLGFNLCAGHFADSTIVGDVRQIFTGSQISYKQLLFEVTERDPLPDLDEARRVISSLQGLGCKVAIDDYGTGHGGMSYLLKLGVDCIKIDKMFVDAISTERYSQTIIETLIELAKSMRMEVIAEGVETFEQVEFLRAKGITVAQGFLFAPPLPASSFLALVEAMEKPKLSIVEHEPLAVGAGAA
jgi:sensor c-di-GMP phosphodiesterase-like protein